MARKKTPDTLKIVELPKREQKIYLTADDFREIAHQAQELALLADDAHQKAVTAKAAENFADFAFAEFNTARKLRDSQQEKFLTALKKILYR